MPLYISAMFYLPLAFSSKQLFVQTDAIRVDTKLCGGVWITWPKDWVHIWRKNAALCNNNSQANEEPFRTKLSNKLKSLTPLRLPITRQNSFI